MKLGILSGYSGRNMDLGIREDTGSGRYGL